MSKRKLSKHLLEELGDAIKKSLLFNSNHSKYTSQLIKTVGNRASPVVTKAYPSTVIFAQFECGTGVCIDSAGVILTCAHCLGEEPEVGIRKFVLFTDGMICLTESSKVDVIADVALLKIVGIYDATLKEIDYNLVNRAFSSVEIASEVVLNETLYCIGQPGTEDLERTRRRKTDYDIVYTSEGVYEQCLEGDINDNTEIGKLQHSCWTYWGHSGAPLVTAAGQLVGLHSSWDDETATRHGVHLLAIRHFLGWPAVVEVEMEGNNGDHRQGNNGGSFENGGNSSGGSGSSSGNTDGARRSNRKRRFVMDLTDV